jgi:hypothetical protein
MFLTKRQNGIYYIAYHKSNGKRALKSTNTTHKSVAERYLKIFEEQFLNCKFLKLLR